MPSSNVGARATRINREVRVGMRTRAAMVRAIVITSLLQCAGCAHSPKLVQPECSNPIPITGHFDRRAPGIWTTIADRQIAAEVARDYGLKLPFEGSTVLTFPTTIDAALLAKMRCDDRIPTLTYDAVMKNVLAQIHR